MFIGPAVLEIWDGRLLGGFWRFLGESHRPAAITGQIRNQDPKIDQKKLVPKIPSKVDTHCHSPAGLLTSLHLQLGHPTATQLTNVFNRRYFSLNVSDCVSHVLQSCSQCQALKTIPHELHEQTSTPQTTTLATNFAADVIRRYRQKIFIMRDTVLIYHNINCEGWERGFFANRYHRSRIRYSC